jgi:hypothetical protein
MKAEWEALVNACYRQLINPDFHVDETGITFSISPEDKKLVQGAGEKKLKRALKIAMARKTMEDVAEIYGVDADRFKKFMDDRGQRNKETGR